VKQNKLLAELVKACSLMKEVQGQMPEKSRFSHKVHEVERILDNLIVDLRSNKKVINQNELLEITQLLRLVFNVLSWFKDLTNSCIIITIRWFYEYRSYRTTSWQTP